MDGLEISEINIRSALTISETARLDASFFQKNYVKLRELTTTWLPLENYAENIVCGPFGSNLLNDNYTDSGIPMVRPFNLRGLRTDSGEIAHLSNSFVESTDLKVFPKETVMFARVGEIGIGITLCDETSISPNIIAAILKPIINPYFVTVFANTKFGFSQLESELKIVAQPTISTDAVRNLRVPPLTTTFQKNIAALFKSAIESKDQSFTQNQKAETLLLDTLGMSDFTPSSESVNIKSLKDSFASSGRLDAEYYLPKYEALLKLLQRDGLTIGDMATVRNERFKPDREGNFEYIEIGGLNGDGTVSAETTPQIEAPSRASQLVRSGDIVTSTVRPIRRLTGLIAPEQEASVCSSGFVVLKPQHITAEVLLVFLRIPLICELLDLQTSATMYPAISEKDLLAIPIHNIKPSIQTQIAELVQQSFKLKIESERLLKVAKRAVELAIEQDEAAGMAYLRGNS